MTFDAAAAFGDRLPSQEMLLRMAGYYWGNVYPDKKAMLALSLSVQQELRQQLRKIHEDAESLSPDTMPLYRTETFIPVDINVETIKEAPLRFGDGYEFGGFLNGSPIYFGQKIPSRWQFTLPPGFEGALAIQDTPYNPSVALIDGCGASWHRSPSGEVYVQMEQDPRELFKQLPTRDGTRLRVWLYMAQRDEGSLYRRFGIILNKKTPSTVKSQKMVSSVWSAIKTGSTEFDLKEFFAAVTGNSIVNEEQNVLRVLETKDHPVVITDIATYYGPTGSAPVVVEGDTLGPGDLVFDVSRFTSFENGTPDWLTELTLPASLFGGTADVSIPSGEHTLSVGSTINGIQYTQGQASGNAADVEKLWLAIQESIPMRDVLATQPATFDVLAFLAERWLRYGVSVSLLRSSTIPEELCDMLKLYREVVPPWVLHVVQFEGDPPSCWTSVDACSN